MKFKTEFRILSEQKETYIEKYINRVISGNIKNLTIKEEWIMLEELKLQREEYVAEVERLNSTDLDAVINARFEEIKEKIAEEVKVEFDEKLAKAKLDVEHYDFVIAKMEERELAKLNEETNIDDADNIEDNNVEA